jgi:hypothetical protein
MIKQDINQLADNATLYALPLVIMGITREQMNMQPNRFYHNRVLANAESRSVVRLNVDTIYSTAWLQLDAEPVLLTAPPSNGRYFLIQFLDAWTNVIAAPGIRTIGNQKATYAITGPKWRGRLPEGTSEIRSPTSMVWVIGRIYVKDVEDFDAAGDFQSQWDMRPLSRVGDRSFTSITQSSEEQKTKQPIMLDTLNSIDAKAFFERFMALTAENLPSTQDASFVREVLEPLDISPGKTKNWENIDSMSRQALTASYSRVLSSLKNQAFLNQPAINGWSGTGSKLQKGFETDYPTRALIALYGLGANLPVDAIYFNADVDGTGQKLSGDLRYRLTFEKGCTPPVLAFWSVTLYDDKGYLVPNSLSRYAIKSADDLIFGADSSLTIYLQPDDPGMERQANWLPTPSGQRFELTLRAYWPKTELLDGKWTPPPILPSECLSFKKPL